MKIAIDNSPLQSGHKVRGVGFYLTHLRDALVKYFPEHDYSFFTDKKELNEAIDVIHYPYFDPFFITLPFFEQYKRVVTVHDLTPLVFPEHFPAGIKGNLSWQVQRFNLHRSQAIITDSDSSTKDVVKYARIFPKKVNTVYLAAGEEFREIKDQSLASRRSGSKIKEIMKKYSLPEKFILYVGDVTWNKNLPRVVQAINRLDIPLVMVGKALTEKDFDRTNSWNADRVKLEEATGGSKNILKLGFVSDDDLVVLYNAATAFVFPSLYEGFGLPVLEAMQSGCPVITTKEGSLAEVAGDGAYFVDAYSEESIADGIKEVFYDQDLQKKLIEKGFQQAKKFSWKKTAEQTIAVYEKVVNSK